MKLVVRFDGTAYKVKKNIMESKEAGKPSIEWYQILVDQSDDVCTLTCSKEVFEKAERGKDYTFEAQFDEETKKFKVVDVLTVPFATAGKQDAKDAKTNPNA